MLEFKTNLLSFTFLDSIDEMSAFRFFLFNKYMSLTVHLPNATAVPDYIATLIAKIDKKESIEEIKKWVV